MLSFLYISVFLVYAEMWKTTAPIVVWSCDNIFMCTIFCFVL
jgi:hypothetical protein